MSRYARESLQNGASVLSRYEILIQLEPPTFIPRLPHHPAFRMRFEAKINKRRDYENERLKQLENNDSPLRSYIKTYMYI